MEPASQDKLNQIEAKLDSFEVKFEQLADAILKLTRIEERIASVIEGNREIRTTIKQADSRLQSVERKQERFTVFERIIWIIVTIAIGGYFAGKFFMGTLS